MRPINTRWTHVIKNNRNIKDNGMKENIKEFISSSIEKDIITTVSKPRSNWRNKVYPKPAIWVTKETVEYLKKRNDK